MASVAPFIIVVGPAKHGKSTFRKALAARLGAEGGSCSDTIYALWAYIAGETVEALQQRPKDEVRATLVALGNWFTTPAESLAENFPRGVIPDTYLPNLEISAMEKPHEGSLIRQAYLSGVRVLDGVRRRKELDAVLPFFDWFDIPVRIYYVYDERKGMDPADNFNLSPSDAHKLIKNNGSKEELEAIAVKIAEEILSESGLDAYTHSTQ